MKPSTFVGNFNIQEGIAVMLAGYASVRAFNTREITTTAEDGSKSTEASISWKKKAQQTYGEENVLKKTDGMLVMTTIIPTFLMFSTAIADDKSYGKTPSAFSIKNATSFVDWLIIAALGFAAYRFYKVYDDIQGAACAGVAALLYLVAMTNNVDDPAAAIATTPAGSAAGE